MRIATIESKNLHNSHFYETPALRLFILPSSLGRSPPARRSIVIGYDVAVFGG